MPLFPHDHRNDLLTRHFGWDPQRGRWVETITYWEKETPWVEDTDGDCFIFGTRTCLWVETIVYLTDNNRNLVIDTQSRETTNCVVVYERSCPDGTEYIIRTETTILDTPERQVFNKNENEWKEKKKIKKSKKKKSNNKNVC